jgi:hypothetical protein
MSLKHVRALISLRVTRIAYRKVYILRFEFDNYLIKTDKYKIGDGEIQIV